VTPSNASTAWNRPEVVIRHIPNLYFEYGLIDQKIVKNPFI